MSELTVPEPFRLTQDPDFQPDTHESHYVQTPYNYTPKLGKKMVRETYIDLGLGLLDCLQDLDKNRQNED